MTEPLETRPRRATRRWIGRLLRWALVVAVLALAAHFLAGIDWSELKRRILGAQPGWVAITVACLLLRWAVWAGRWRLAAKRLGPAPGLGPMWVMVIASAALNHLTPAARVFGGLLRARYLSHRTDSALGRAYGSVLFDQLIHQVTMSGMTILALAAAAWSLRRYDLAAASAGLVIALIAVLTYVWNRMRRGGGKRLGAFARRLAERAQKRRGKGRSPRTERVLDHGREAVGVIRRLLDDGPLLGGALTLGVVYAVVNAGALWAVFISLGSDVGFAAALASVALGVTAGALLGTPGGVGTAEAAIVAALVALGVNEVEATAGALLYRGLHYLTVFGGGLPALAALELHHKRQLSARSAPPPADD